MPTCPVFFIPLFYCKHCYKGNQNIQFLNCVSWCSPSVKWWTWWPSGKKCYRHRNTAERLLRILCESTWDLHSSWPLQSVHEHRASLSGPRPSWLPFWKDLSIGTTYVRKNWDPGVTQCSVTPGHYQHPLYAMTQPIQSTCGNPELKLSHLEITPAVNALRPKTQAESNGPAQLEEHETPAEAPDSFCWETCCESHTVQGQTWKKHLLDRKDHGLFPIPQWKDI